jgi:hypothetical protein
MPEVWRRQAVAALILALAVFPVGCGGSGSSGAAKTAEARFVALFNTICGKIYTNRAESPPTKAELAMLRSLAESASEAPRVARFKSDLAVRRKLRAVLDKLPKRGYVTGHGRPNIGSLLDQAYRINVKVYADKKALGLSGCLGPRPQKPIEG